MVANDKFIQIDNLNQVRRNFNQYGAEFKTELKQTHLKAAKIVEKAARPLVPVRTGKLLASVRASGTQRFAAVRAGKKSVPYAPPIHWGWAKRGIKPNPFLYEALDKRRDEVIKAYEKQIAELGRRFGRR